MPAAARPLNEASRYAALMGYRLRKGVLGDTDADRLVREAARCFDVPQSAIAVVGALTVYFVAEHGVGFHSIPRDVSFCAYAIHTPKLLCVPDPTSDPRFVDKPVVVRQPFVRFYAGATDRQGWILSRYILSGRQEASPTHR
jgi:GAF domain-containing protein